MDDSSSIFIEEDGFEVDFIHVELRFTVWYSDYGRCLSINGYNNTFFFYCEEKRNTIMYDIMMRFKIISLTD